MKIIKLITLFIFIFYSVVARPNNVTFESAEHIFMGDQVILTGLLQQDAQHPIPLLLPNGLQLTYGEILAMPDFYGDPNHQISSEKTSSDQQHFFKTIFNTLAKGDTAYFNAFWPIIQNERTQVMNAVKAHQDVTAVYKKIESQENIDLAVATHFQYLNLALTDFDHFNQDAITAYQAGHAVAVKTAVHGFQIKLGNDAKANQFCETQGDYLTCLQTQAKNKLIVAYAENAFASHFLSDRFAAGHIRNPYRALYQTRPIAILGALSGNLMHDEENRLGVIVTNVNHQYWMTYGDEYYFSPQNKTNRQALRDVLQASADEINAAFQSGVDPDPQSQKIISLIPEPIQPGETAIIDGVSYQQTAPLYQMILGSVWQRIDVNNPNDDQWTPIWSTVLTLLTYHAPNQCAVPMKWKLILSHNHMEDTLHRLGY